MDKRIDKEIRIKEKEIEKLLNQKSMIEDKIKEHQKEKNVLISLKKDYESLTKQMQDFENKIDQTLKKKSSKVSVTESNTSKHENEENHDFNEVNDAVFIQNENDNEHFF